MIISWFGATGVIDEAPNASRECDPGAFDRWKPIAEKLNETRTMLSETVHLGEIAVTLGAAAAPQGAPETVRRCCRIACRPPMAPI
jgi:hypothetical protein